MSKAFDDWSKARVSRHRAEQWAELIGKESVRATARHRGTISSASGKFCIHYQPSDGATNYHDASPEFCAKLEQVMKERAIDLISASLEKLREDERVALIACEEELTAMQASIAKAKESA